MTTDPYEAGVQKLIERVKQIHEADKDWSPTPKRRELLDIATRLEELAALLASNTAATFDLEMAHDAQKDRPPPIGPDGFPAKDDDDPYYCSYDGVRLQMIALAGSAREAADALPDPRQKHALPFAAMGLLHLRYEHGFRRPILGNASLDVEELEYICEQAGISVTKERMRGALSDALKQFDPCFFPPGIRELLR